MEVEVAKRGLSFLEGREISQRENISINYQINFVFTSRKID